jgi:DNA-binding response OmpR family regulator
MIQTILHIEDDQEIGEWVSEFLTEKGYKVIWLTSGYDALKYMEEIDLTVLDIMLPGLDGYTIGQRLKQKYPQVPMLLLTARTAMEDKLQGLSFADDYVTKPYHPDELIARIKILLRRTTNSSPDLLQIMHLKIDPKMNRIYNTESNQEIILTGKQFHIFHFFIAHVNQILTHKQLFESVWGEPYMKGDKTLMVHIRHLREKIELDSSRPQIIETIRGVGYRMKG